LSASGNPLAGKFGHLPQHRSPARAAGEIQASIS